jgi:hypothetical protein
MTKTYDLPETPWYNNHENLYKLAEWLRENRGWNFCKDNLLDVLETPWSWEKEWRLASGDVTFTEVTPDLATFGGAVNGTRCDWCGDAPVGYISYVEGQTNVVEWVTTYRDGKTNDLACDDCAGTAVNFAETTNLAATQVLS